MAAASLALLACGAPKSVGINSADCWAPSVRTMAGYQPPEAAELKVTPVYIRDLPCKNWSSALETAKRLSGCVPSGTRVTCPKCSLPCNICQFIEDGHYPEAHIVPHIGGSIWPIAALARPKGSTDEHALFRDWLCERQEHRDLLAQVMVHEAIHLCKHVAPATPTMKDGPLRKLLGINPWPYPKDTLDLVDECWKNR